MSNMKNLADILKVCSILPIFAVMPAMAETVTERQVIKESKTYNNLIADGIVSSIVNNGGVFYMEDAQDTTLTFKGNTVFSNNSLTNLGMGGAIGNGWLSTKNPDKWPSFTPGGKIVFDGKASFSNNTAKDPNGGGALFNFGVGTVENPDIVFNGIADFTGNKALGESPSVYVGGGAIHHHGGAIVFNQDATFTNNTSATKGGAVMASGDVVFKGNATFAGNTAKINGGGLAIVGGDVVFEKNASFTGNTAGNGAAIAMTEAGGSVLFKKAAVFEKNKGTATLVSYADSASIVFEQGAKFSNNTNVQNGTLQNAGTLELKSGDFTFVRNTGTNGGGLKTSGTVNVNTTGSVLFDSNVTTDSAGAIDTSGTTTFIAENVSFLNNSSDSGYAGAVFNTGDLCILGKENIFSGNIAKDTKTVKSGGGALHNRGSKGTASLIVGTNDSENVFKNNQSYAHGGAIVARAFDGEQENSDVVINGDTEFVGNFATLNGGAIWNSAVESDGSIGIANFAINGNVEFEHNTAGMYGGAIYNDSVFVLSNAEFEDNTASISGGAIYNLGDLTIENGDFENNKITSGNGDGGALYTNTGTLKLVNTNFIDNSAEENPIGGYGYGGAIYAQGGIIDIQGGEYSGNKALFGGAIYVSKSATSTNFQDVTFDGNQATGSGALGVFGKNTTLTNLTFTNNSTTGSYETAGGGAALLIGAVGQVEINNSTFIGNKSASTGGAIATRYVLNATGTKNGMKDAMLDIVGGTFTGNIANTKGGAIYNTFYNSKNALGFAYVDDSTFTSNEALEGGAIYNVGIIDAHEGQAKMALNDVTFTGNKAAAFGGAIYNEEGGTIVLTGKNTFANNTAKGGANDIHNLGTLEIASGTTTIGGGISGTGSLAIAKGTVLNIGTSTIAQDKIEIDGTVTASVLSERSFGRLLGDVEADRDAKLELTVGSVGTYDIFDHDVDINVVAGDTYIVTNNGADGVVIETKSVEDLAADTGLTTNAAAVVVGLANADSRAMQQVSLAAQTALNAGDNATVEAETAKVAPDNKPVAQSVAMSVQNQVVNMAANRMATVTPMGRSGGDTPMAAGAWVQGMFNKTKMNDQFHGYSRGFALGGDTVIADAFTIGGGYAYGTTDVHADNRDTDIESSTVFMYAQYKPTNWYLNATLSYTMSEYEEHTTVFGMPMVNTYDVDSYGAQMMTGYTFASGITPEMGVRYLYVESDDYNNGLGDITVDDAQYLAGVMGLKYAFEIESDWALKLRPELRAAATYDFLSDEAIATVTMPGAPAYVVNGDRLSRMGGEFGIGLTAEYKGLNVSLTYDLDLHKDYTSQTGMLKFRYNF